MLSEIVAEFHTQIMDVERIPFAFAAVILVSVVGMVTGPVAGQAQPFLWLVYDKTLGHLGDRLNKTHRPQADLVFRGFIMTAIILLLAFVIGRAAGYLANQDPVYGIMELFLLCLSMTGGAIWFALWRLYKILESKESGKGAYFTISRSSRVNLSISDDYGITRCGIRLAARSFDKGMVAPVFWYLIGGLPLAFLYASVAALAWRFGKDGFTKGFGAAPLALERLLGFIPSAVSGVLLALAAAFTPTAKTARGLDVLLHPAHWAPYAQGGWPLSVMAWVLNISLGGAMQDITGSAIKAKWVGPKGASAKSNHKHLRRAIYLSLMAHILFLAALGGAYLWGSGFSGFSLFSA